MQQYLSTTQRDHISRLANRGAASGAFGTPRKRPRYSLAAIGGKDSRQISRSSEKRFATVAKVRGISFATWILFSHLATWRTASASPDNIRIRTCMHWIENKCMNGIEYKMHFR